MPPCAEGVLTRMRQVFMRAAYSSSFCRLCDGIQIDRGRMAVAAVCDELLGLVKRVRKILGAVHGQNRGEFFVREFLRELYAVDLADENFRIGRHGETGQLCNFAALWPTILALSAPLMRMVLRTFSVSSLFSR